MRVASRLRVRWGARTGSVTVMLFAGTSSAALGLALGYHLGVAQTLVTVLLGGGAPAALYLAWATYRLGAVEGSAQASSARLSRLADELAIAVASQWRAEAQARRLHDPFPLPVRWQPADAPLVASWDALVGAATSGLGWPTPPPLGGWALGPSELAGIGDELADILARVPTGRMVVLGEPGSGKTMLMVRLVLDMLARRETGKRVPVLVPLASWDPTTEELRDWLATRLSIDYPALVDPVSTATGMTTSIDALLDLGLILPILDGLDEIADALRGPAVARINDALRPGEQIVVTCRTDAYREAVRPLGGIEVTLSAAAGIELQPLDSHILADYLRADAGGPAAVARWEPVLAALPDKEPLARVLSNPLMAGLARVIYNPRPYEVTGPASDPSELCNFANETLIQQHLFDAFITAVYRPKPGTSRPSRRVRSARKWLHFLAAHLEENIRGPDLAWWQLSKATPRWVMAMAAAIATGLAVLLAIETAYFLVGLVYFGLTRGLGTGLRLGISGMVLGFRLVPLMALTGMMASTASTVLTHEATQYPRFIIPQRSVTVSAISGLAFGLMSGIAIWLLLSPLVGLMAGTLSGIAAAIVTLAARESGANLRFRKGIQAGVAGGIVTGVTTGVVVGYFGGISSGTQTGIAFGIIAGLTIGVIVIIANTSDHRPSRGLHWNFRRGALVGFMGLIIAGLAVGFSVPAYQRLAYAITCGLGFGLAGAIVAGMEGIPDDLSTAVNPKVVLARDRSTTLVLALLTGVAGALAAGFVTGMLYGERNGDLGYFSSGFGGGFAVGVAFGLAIGIAVGLGVALVVPLAVSGFGSAWPQWIIVRCWLAMLGRTPVRLMGFLSDAHRLGVLRQVGAVYQFRHIELQHQMSRTQVPEAVTRPTANAVRQIRRLFLAVAIVIVLAVAAESASVLAGVSPLASGSRNVVPSLPSVVEPPISTLGRVAATKHFNFQPWISGRLSSGEHVVARVSGRCDLRSYFSQRADAYACVVGEYYFDPCFANPADFSGFFTSRVDVACAYPSGRGSVLIVRSINSLRYPNPTTSHRYDIWLLILANGDVCYYFGEASAAMREQITGECFSGSVYGDLVEIGPVWKIYYREQTRSTKWLIPIAETYS